tara:strand:- start:22 stop:231 length:210 start_codon:yes stop_codon:yes gene_type:complete
MLKIKIKKKIKKINNLRLFIKTINPDENNLNSKLWIDKEWTEIAKFNTDNSNTFSWTNLPTKAKKIFRD